ncbi:MAG TPA: malate synthase G, partial [Candidatus Omnitrophota bacterium]|nr:malate synthase G [Candidatus Omnitrophota bacterium]
MTDRVQTGGISIAKPLYDFITNEAIPGTGLAPEQVWNGLDALLRDLAPRNRALLARRDELQTQIDAWHRDRRGKPLDRAEYTRFLRDIGYLLPEGPDFQVGTAKVDPEISTLAGPQLVVPVMNARYALNAANARWGSLYDALYGTDALPDSEGAERGAGYNPRRGALVIAQARQFLDRAVPL